MDAGPQLLCGWGRTAPTCAARVVTPGTLAELQDVLTRAHARGTLARGAGRSYGDAAQNAGGAVVATRRLASIDWLEPTVVRVGAGVTLDALLAEIVPRGQFVPVTPGTRYVTTGGAFAADVHGKNHAAAGSFARHVRSIEIVRADGERVVAVRGEPAFRATAGGMGLTGVIVSLTLELAPIETSVMRVETWPTADLDAALERLGEPGHAVAWLDTEQRARGVVTVARHARADELPAGTPPPLRPPPRAPALPRWIPRAPLSRATVRAFNAARLRRARRGVTHEPLERVFYALDAVGDWNRLYGAPGLVQHQFAVPRGSADVLRLALERAARLPCTLAVLKRLGAGGGQLSFPIPGWTLALDFPARADGLADALDAIDEAVAEAGGRVYLAKDSRMRPELVPAMYPELGEWRELRATLDPHERLRSDLSRRLRLI